MVMCIILWRILSENFAERFTEVPWSTEHSTDTQNKPQEWSGFFILLLNKSLK